MISSVAESGVLFQSLGITINIERYRDLCNLKAMADIPRPLIISEEAASKLANIRFHTHIQDRLIGLCAKASFVIFS